MANPLKNSITTLAFLLNGFLFCSLCYTQASPDSIQFKNRKKLIYSTYAVGYTSSMYGLYQLWYKDYALTSFHFFNDNSDWLQMDKVGHLTTSYYLAKTFNHSLHWGGVPRKKAIIQSAIGSFFYLSSIEVLDGFSPNWGASSGDVLANLSGIGLFAAQEYAWQEQRIKLKFSTHPSPYAIYRPSLLGNNFVERMLKDYNGQTYWLSCGIKEFVPKSNVPKWLNLSLGYSGDGMIGGSQNPAFDHQLNPYPHFERTRQYFLSVDVDMDDLPIKNKTLRTILGALNFIKIPAPTLQINSKGNVIFHPIYF